MNRQVIFRIPRSFSIFNDITCTPVAKKYIHNTTASFTMEFEEKEKLEEFEENFLLRQFIFLNQTT